MNIRAQVSSVFHLDKMYRLSYLQHRLQKTSGTDRKGVEYMWWNNVETKPGTGYPTKWEDQQQYKGGWEKKPARNLHLKMGGKAASLGRIFHNPDLPTMGRLLRAVSPSKYQDLTQRPGRGTDQPTARPVVPWSAASR